jgi:hypothetical protein
METAEIQLDREDIVLLMLESNERVLGKSALNGITRLEKLLYLLERETDFEGIGEFFVFEPHNFGPFAKDVYAAVEFLSACELVEVRDKSYISPYSSADEAKLLSEISENEVRSAQVTEKQFSLTDNGRKVAKIIRDAVHQRRPTDIQQLDSIVLKYGTWPLNHLIRYVYRQYPEMTSKSIHPEAANLR